jgi:hypothetical protein
MIEANVEIFRTNIEDKNSADRVVERLSTMFPTVRFNVDLNDPEKILRMEGKFSKKHEVQQIAKSLGLICEAI